MLSNNFKLLTFLVCAAILSFPQAPTAHGFAAYDLPNYNFVDLATNPNQFASWDPDVPNGNTTTVTYRFDPSFTNDSRIRNQIRLAFDQWDSAWSTADGANYSYMRNSGTQPFGDIRSIMVHEIGHALVFHHPNIGSGINRNYVPNATPPPPIVTQADQNNEVMRSWIPAGAYTQILSHDELDGYNYFYGNQNLNFAEIFGGTADILVSAGPESNSGTWAATRPAGTQRNATDVTQGWQLTSAPINFNSTSSTPMGFRTLGINWDYQNPSSTKLTHEFEIRTRGTNNPTPLFHYDGSSARHFNTYTTSAIGGANQKDDLLHKWSNTDPGDFDPSDIIHVGIEQDVWDWTVVSAEVVHPDGTRSNAPLLSFHDWNQTVTGVTSPSVPSDGSDAQAIEMGPPVRVVAQGVRLVNTAAMPIEVKRIGLGIVDDMKLQLEDLNGETMQLLERKDKFKMLDLPPIRMDKREEWHLIFDGDPIQTANTINIPGGKNFLGHEVFGYVETVDPQGGAIVGNFALLGTMPITMPLGPMVLLGDANNDFQVTGADLIVTMQNFAATYSVDPRCNGLGLGDADDNCQVTGADLIAVQQNFGNVLGGTSALTPEPTTLSVLGVWCLALIRRQSRPS